MTKRTGLVFFPAFDWQIAPNHPEREERLLYTKDQLEEEGVFDLKQIAEIRPRFAEIKDIARTHASFPNINSNITDGHLAAAGCSIAVAEKYLKGEIKNGFALVRPPGHHAMHVVHGNRGFCNINNEAIMVDYLRKNHLIKKVAIIDTDVHHGDGTQDIFYDDPNVLFISLHQDGRTLYPGSGFTNEIGGPKAVGYNINFPLPPGTTDEGFLYVLDNAIMPVLNDFKPDIIINSAGQDNHFSDPLARMQMTAAGYAKLNETLSPHIAVLEGGYSVEGALPYVNLAIILAMAGLDYTHVAEPNKSIIPMTTSMQKEIQYLCDENLKLWKNRAKASNKDYNKEKSWFTRTKGVFYDTDGIRESQKEFISTCSNCQGLKMIISQAERGHRGFKALILSVPFNSCDKCQKDAEIYYQQGKTKKEFDAVYLQNKALDKYIYFYTEHQREEEIL